jgi:hypothetical protein
LERRVIALQEKNKVGGRLLNIYKMLWRKREKGKRRKIK